VFCQTYPKNKVSVNGHVWQIEANPDDPTETAIDVHNNPTTNLPTSTGLHPESLAYTAKAFQNTVSTTHAQNLNLSEPQKELLRWHYKLGHIGLQAVQFLMRQGALASTEAMCRLHSRVAQLKHADLPKCSACMFGKQTSRPVPGKKWNLVKERSGILAAVQ